MNRVPMPSKKKKHWLQPHEQRSLFGILFFAVIAAGAYWVFMTDGMPILWGPSASASEVAAGRDLFEHEWKPNDPIAHGDGLGPVFNAKSCAACHFQGGVGGGGSNEHNALAFEIMPRPSDPKFVTGTIHNFSVDPANRESQQVVRSIYPIIPGSSRQEGDSHCRYTVSIPAFDPLRTQHVQPTALFGAGWVDLISDRAILRNARDRAVEGAVQELKGKLDFEGIPVGQVRKTAGGVGKFGWKAQFASLDEFVAAACANELGLGTPTIEQAKPLAGPSHPVDPDLDRKQFRSLVAFVKTLPKPVEAVPEQPAARETAARGKQLFNTIGCAVCHVPDLGGVKGVYSDFLLYVLDDPSVGGGTDYGPASPQPLPERADGDPRPQEWKTPALWGVADSAPYFHDGGAATLKDAIMRHRGQAKVVNEKYKKLSAEDQAALIAFLGTLKAPPDAPQLRDPSVTKLDKR